MENTPRGLREVVIRALARVSLVLSLTVLGAVFMSTAAQGDEPLGGSALSTAADPAGQTVQVTTGEGRAPSTVGLVVALVVVGVGMGILAFGAIRTGRGMVDDPGADATEAPADEAGTL